MSLRIEAPVVVKPDIDSKYASVIWPIEPANKKGREPKKPALNQQRVTMAIPSLWLRDGYSFVLISRKRAMPLPDVIMKE
jgi:hypothetical protein